ncbi:protein of unknown function [Rubritalea squalenifaciens DSM 18772]|uniref:GYF domain-containing protein n=1 Tax=Rubritalea squalenifaciens DSM 18772 TaxID=1123071 RepID=A0A1M6DZJ0_9BACT|nr:DUF4339 domain-containing protein [Rubritalea squalenifaciens]SHI78540.1 protein of unknown function [Rubritalea squalenifaciens DSM 18772]
MQSNEWYYTLGGTRRGPVTEDKMRELILSKQLTADGTLVWCKQMTDWQQLGELEIFQPSLEILAKQEQEEKRRQAAKRSYVRPIKREYEDPAIYLKRLYFWGALRSSLACLAVLTLWAWFYIPNNQSSLFIAAIPLGIAAGLCSGIYYPERNCILFKAMAGAIAASSYLLAKLIACVIDLGAITGENLLYGIFITHSVDGITALISSFSLMDFAGAGTSFLIAFALSIHGLTLWAEIYRYRYSCD